MAFNDRLCNVDQLLSIVLRVGAEHLERPLLVDRMAGHQDPLRLLDHRPAAERSLEVLILGEALQRDVDRALQFLGVSVDDIGEDAALGRLVDVGLRRWSRWSGGDLIEPVPWGGQSLGPRCANCAVEEPLEEYPERERQRAADLHERPRRLKVDARDREEESLVVLEAERPELVEAPACNARLLAVVVFDEWKLFGVCRHRAACLSQSDGDTSFNVAGGDLLLRRR